MGFKCPFMGINSDSNLDIKPYIFNQEIWLKWNCNKLFILFIFDRRIIKF